MKKRVLTILFPVLLTFVLAMGGWAKEQQPASGKPCCNKPAQAAQAQQPGCANCAKGKAVAAGCQNCAKGKAAAVGCQNCAKAGGAGCEKCAKCAACENCAKGGDCAKCEKCAKNGAAGCAKCGKGQAANAGAKMPCGGCATKKQGEAGLQEKVKKTELEAQQEVKPCCNKSKKM